MRPLTARQQAVLDVLASAPKRGFDLDELARRCDTSTHGVARTAASLWHRGLAVKFVGGIVPQRVHYQAAE